jgi:molecular chaperone Hsp33
MTDDLSSKNRNEIHRFLLQEAPIRGESVRLTSQWQEVVKRHELPPAVQRALGELTAAAVLLSAALKFDGALVLQILGDGPVHLMVVESNSVAASVGELGTKFRATAKLRESIDANTINPEASFKELVNPFGTGRFVMTLDPRIKLPGQQTYQAIVPLEGDSVAEIIAGYMARSEQIPTRLWLAADANQASGLLLQKLPSEGGSIELKAVDAQKVIADESWTRLEQLADTVGPDELLSTDSDQLMHRLFWQEPMRSLDQRTCYFGCSCTREKVGNMLQTLGLPEVKGILTEREKVQVNCDYCNTAYDFDAIDCAALFAGTLSSTIKPPDIKQ